MSKIYLFNDLPPTKRAMVLTKLVRAIYYLYLKHVRLTERGQVAEAETVAAMFLMVGDRLISLVEAILIPDRWEYYNPIYRPRLEELGVTVKIVRGWKQKYPKMKPGKKGGFLYG